eukprot:5383869-Prymnesium_polylepis.1
MSMTHEPEVPDAEEPTTDCTALQTRRDSRRMRMIHVRCAEDSATRRKPRWTAKCRFYIRVNYRRRNATLTSP